MKKFDLTFATCDKLPNMDPDDLLALSILQRRGWQCAGAIWNDPAVNWRDAGLVVVRSTWDYHLHAYPFLDWAKSRAGDLLNPIDLIVWNANKRYLVDLQKQGVSVIPTELISEAAVSAQEQLKKILTEHRWSDIIIKPTFGLATYGVKRFSVPQQLAEAHEHVRMLLQHSEVLVQPFMAVVSDYGERALTFIDGVYSHCIRKVPFQVLGPAGHAGEKGVVAAASEIVFAQKIVAALPQVPLYARVDLVPGPDGALLLMELELVEPSLFLAFDASAPARFANALELRLQQRAAVSQAVAATPVA